AARSAASRSATPRPARSSTACPMTSGRRSTRRRLRPSSRKPSRRRTSTDVRRKRLFLLLPRESGVLRKRRASALNPRFRGRIKEIEHPSGPCDSPSALILSAGFGTGRRSGRRDWGGTMAKAGGVAGERLRSFLERIERLEEERSGLTADIREVYAEAKGS